MIRMKGTKPDGTPFLFLGVDRENINRLTAGKPLICSAARVGVERDVMIVFGENLQDVVDQLAKAGVVIPPATGLPS